MKKRISVIGYGGQGGWHCGQLQKSDVAELAGIYDVLPEKRCLAQKNGICAYPSFNAVLDDSSVDAVVIAVPNDSHRELVVSALKKGKNVICEKPVAVSVKDYDAMTAAARKNGKLFTVHQNRRWDVDYLAIKHLCESGEIGEPLRVESRIHGSRGIPSDWRCRKEHGGGMILDWGVHLIDQMLQIIPGDTIIRVFCETTAYTHTEVDDGFRLSLCFASGKTAYIEVGTYNFIAMPRFYLQCRQGTAVIADWRQNAKVARLKAWNEKDVLPVEAAAGVTKTMAPRDSVTLEKYEAARPVSDVHDFYRNFCAAMDGTAELLIKPEEVRRVLQVMEAAFESDRKQQTMEVSL